MFLLWGRKSRHENVNYLNFVPIQITFNPQGTLVMTASADKTARLWDPETGECRQILEGHTDEIFSCAFNYEGNTIITGQLLL